MKILESIRLRSALDFGADLAREVAAKGVKLSVGGSRDGIFVEESVVIQRQAVAAAGHAQVDETVALVIARLIRPHESDDTFVAAPFRPAVLGLHLGQIELDKWSAHVIDCACTVRLNVMGGFFPTCWRMCSSGS